MAYNFKIKYVAVTQTSRNRSTSGFRGQTASEATQNVINVQLPRIQEMMSSGELRVDNVDVFCEQNVFDVQQSRDILLAGKAMGLNINFHGEELHRLNSAEVRSLKQSSSLVSSK